MLIHQKMADEIGLIEFVSVSSDADIPEAQGQGYTGWVNLISQGFTHTRLFKSAEEQSRYIALVKPQRSVEITLVAHPQEIK